MNGDDGRTLVDWEAFVKRVGRGLAHTTLLCAGRFPVISELLRELIPAPVLLLKS